ncbi:hypothetical protein DQ04_01431050 [Trypanosoma grayi]|uniref:hypothetical protein n=1 Tax=Trypanosoma grayi TaxID=71804 RepID=UPI0004F4B1C0|nr:hypothetical protein DQ04_01431050 [Trypanosoma grayi]KEG12776.1 hypothetical protein DQ04_01431050 [Trypanosoma grayi]
MRAWRSTASEEQPLGGSHTNNTDTGVFAPPNVFPSNSRNAVASGVDLFGGMEILRTRHKKTAPSTAGSHTPFAESVASVQLKEPVSPVAPPKGDEPFFMRFDIKTDKAQDEVEDPKVTQMRQRLERYYKEYNPSKIPRLEDTLANYKGREDELFRLLVAKYGPEPEPLQASALPQNSGFFLGAHCEVGAAFDFIAGGTVQKNGNDQGCAANVSTGCSFTFMENNERGVAVPPQKSSPAGLDFCENAATAQPAFECTTGNSNAASGGLVVVPPSTGVTSHCEETEGKAAALEDVEVEKEGEAEEEEGTPQLKDATEAYNTNERDGENSHSGSANSKSGGDEEETLWGRQRQELLEAQRGVLVARACLTKVLDNVCAAIEERRLSMATVVDFEDRIERCVAQEAFEQADALSMELEQLGQRVAVLDAEPERLIALLAECRDELEAAVRRLAQLLQQHRQELIESKDSEERRVKKFISDVAFSLENRRDKVTAALERARRTESNSLQEVVNLRERNTRLEEKLLEQTSGLRASQEQLSREKAEIDTEIAALEARLEKLRQTRAEKAVALQDIELNLQHMTLEHNTLASEVNSLIAEEEIRLQAAATDLAQHQNEIETLHCEEDAFAAKRTALLRELQDGTAKIAVYEQRHALLATETVAAVRDYAAALTTILQARGAGCGVLFPAPPTINATVSPTESPLLQVHRLQQQLRSLDVADEQSEALIASLTIQVTGMRNKIPLLEAEKKGAVQAKRFKEAQLKAEEIRALTASIEELSAASAAAQAILSGNVEKRTLLQQQLAKERIKSVNRVQQFLDSYRDTLANAVQATAAPLNVLQLSADEQGPDDLAAAVRRLMTTLEEECRGVLQPDKSGAETTAITIARAAAPEEEVPLDLGETTTRAQLEAELSVLHMEQDAAAAREDFEECERLQDRIETLEARLCASE